MSVVKLGGVSEKMHLRQLSIYSGGSGRFTKRTP